MSRASSWRRFLAVYVAAVLAVLGPVAHIHQARADSPGIKTVAATALAGGAVLFAISAMSGPAKAVATVGMAGTGASTMLGGAIGSMMTGVKAVFSTIGTGFSSLMAAVGLGGGGGAAASTAVAAASKPMWLAPVALIGAGLLAYYFYKKYFSFQEYTRDNAGRYDRTAGRRYDDPYYASRVGLPTPGYNVAPIGGVYPARLNTAPVGGIYSPDGTAAVNYTPSNNYGVGYRPTTFLDRFKSAVTGGRYTSPATLSAGLAGGVGNFYMGGPAAFSLRSPSYLNGFGTASISGPDGISGTPFDIPGIGDPARVGRTDGIGRGLTGGDAILIDDRTSLQTVGAPQNTPVPASPDLKRAQDAKTAAYNRMIGALKSASDGAVGDEVKKAIADYQTAETRVKELSGR